MHLYFVHVCLYVTYTGATYFLADKISKQNLFHKLTPHLPFSPTSLAHLSTEYCSHDKRFVHAHLSRNLNAVISKTVK